MSADLHEALAALGLRTTPGTREDLARPGVVLLALSWAWRMSRATRWLPIELLAC